MAPSRRTSHGPGGNNGPPHQPTAALQLPPEDTPLHELRRQQIQSLFDNHFSAKERSPGSIYQVTVSLPPRSFGQPLVVSVLLPAQFPTEPPSLTVSPPIIHPWVSPDDGSKVTKHPGLLQGRWNQHISLGRLVQEFADALVAQPPRLLPVPPPSSVSSGAGTGQELSSIPIHPSLQGKSIEELELLLKDSEAFTDFFEDLEQVQTTRKMERPLINANLKLAEESVALEESYLSAQARLNGLIQDQSRLMSGLDDLCYKHQKSKMRFSTTSVRERFSKAIQEADGESERLLLEFQAGTLPPDKFLKEYRASRRLVHLRSGRMERLGAPIDDSQEDEDVWSQNRFRD